MNVKANNFESAPVASCYDGGYIAHLRTIELQELLESMDTAIEQNPWDGFKKERQLAMRKAIYTALRADNIVD